MVKPVGQAGNWDSEAGSEAKRKEKNITADDIAVSSLFRVFFCKLGLFRH